MPKRRKPLDTGGRAKRAKVVPVVPVASRVEDEEDKLHRVEGEKRHKAWKIHKAACDALTEEWKSETLTQKYDREMRELEEWREYQRWMWRCIAHADEKKTFTEKAPNMPICDIQARCRNEEKSSEALQRYKDWAKDEDKKNAKQEKGAVKQATATNSR